MSSFAPVSRLPHYPGVQKPGRTSRHYPNHDDFYYIEAANQAATRISLDCLVLTRNPLQISRDELEFVFLSPYCYSSQWLKDFAQLRRLWLTEDAVNWLLEKIENQLTEQISPFPERAEQYAVLASIAAIHQRSDAAHRLVKQAASNMISHGEHKDMLFFQVLESIVAYHKATSTPNDKRNVSLEWLFKIAPAIASIKDFTDGDETGGLPREIADTLSEVEPELLPIYYQWQAEREDFYNATHTLHVFIKTADLSDLFNQAIAKTAVDEESFRILKKRCDDGDVFAATILSELLAYLGERDLELYEEYAAPSQSTVSSSTKPLPLSEDYEPEHLVDFLEALQQHGPFWESKPLSDWIAYWSNAGRKYEVYQAIKAYVNDGKRLYQYMPVFDLALSLYGKEEAYPWLLKSHIADYGWNHYFTSKEHTIRRWEIVKEYYPDRWLRFIQDTVAGKRMYSTSWQLDELAFVRIIEYCIFMNQLELAKELIETIVISSLEYVTELDLSEPEWIPG